MALTIPTLLPVFFAFGALLVAVPLVALAVFVFGGRGSSGPTDSSETMGPHR